MPTAAVSASDKAFKAKDYASSFFIFHTGVVSTNPYKIRADDTSQPTRYFLEDSGSATAGYVEASFRHRSAWLEPEEITLPFNLEARIGTSFFGDSTTATSIAGTGELNAELTVGYDLLLPSWTDREVERRTSEMTKPSFGIGPELLIGTTTDRQSQDNHPYYMLGLCVAGAVPFLERADVPAMTLAGSLLGASTWRPMRKVEYAIGVYYGGTDFPDFIGDTNEVRSHQGFPRYVEDYAIGLRVDLRVPFGETSYLLVGGRMFDDATTVNDVALWSLSIGFSIPIGDIGQAIFAK